MTSTAIVERQEQPGSAVVWTPTFVLPVQEMTARVEAKRAFMANVMREGEHYGTIPGTPKPTLLKPGAELLLSSMSLFAELVDADTPTIDYDGSQHGGEGLIRFRRICRIYRQTGHLEHERVKVAQAEGACSSRETKYRYRFERQHCPQCNMPAILRSKYTDRDTGDVGWWCNKKAGGCGANFVSDDTRITEQKTGRVLNPEVADTENTVLKMADKRAFVAATLLATGCSDIFTQDLEDSDDYGGATTTAKKADSKPAEARQGQTVAQKLPPIRDDQRKKIAEMIGDAPEGDLASWLYELTEGVKGSLDELDVAEAQAFIKMLVARKNAVTA